MKKHLVLTLRHRQALPGSRGVLFTTVVSLLLLGMAFKAPAQTEVSGTINTDTTWTLAGSPYRVTGNVMVSAGVTLTIQPGVTVEFERYHGLWIDGTLTAAGTAAAPVTFTGTTEQAGWWRGIHVQNAGAATLDHIVVACAGYFEAVGLLKSGSGSLTVRNSTFRDIAGDGMRLSNSSGETLIEQSTFTGNSHSGLQLTGSQAAVTGSTFTDNTYYGIHKEPYNHLIDYASCTFNDNGIASVGVKGGTIGTHPVWAPGAATFRVLGIVTVSEGASLTILAGVTVEFERYHGLWIDGALTATGTAAAPITFTGTTEQAGWWRGIHVQNAGAATLDHIVVACAGYFEAVGLLKSGSGSLTVHNGTLRDSFGDGLRLHNSTGVTLIEQSTFTGNSHSGLQLTGSQAAVTHSTFTDNTYYGIHQEPGNHLIDYATCVFANNGIACVGVKAGTIGTTPTWAPGAATFRVLGIVTVSEGASLTILAGVTVEFERYHGLWIDGALTAAGTAAAPVTFTGTTEQAGWWRGIHVQNAGAATLDHIVVACAGYFEAVGLLKSGSGSLTVHNGTFRDTTGDGVRLHNSTGVTLIEQSTFTGNSHSGLQLTGSQAAVTHSTFTDNTYYGIHQEANNNLIDYSTCTFSKNAIAPVAIKSGTVQADTRFALNGSPYRVLGSVTVTANASLTVDPGVTVEFERYHGLWIDGALIATGTAAAPITFIGTTEQAGWWRGIQLRHAGVARLEHAVVACAGFFESVGLLKSTLGTLTMRNTVIRDTAGDGLRLAAGGWTWMQHGVGGDGDGYLWGFSPGDGHNSYFIAPELYHGDWRAYAELRFQLWSQQGAYYDENGATWRGDVYLASGDKFAHTMLDRDHSADWEEFTVRFDDPARQWTLGGGAATLDEILENVTAFHIRAEYGIGDTYAGLDNVELFEPGGVMPAIASTFPAGNMQGWTIDIGSALNPGGIEGIGSLVSANNLFRNNTRGVRVGRNASFDDNTSDFVGNSAQDVLQDGGTIDREVVWNLNRDYSLFVSGSITVGATGRLRIGAGTVAKFAQYAGLYVDGDLDARGTGEAPIHFTDWRDDTVGGDANRDGNDTTPAPGWWSGIFVRSGGSAAIEHAVLAYSGYWDAVGILKTGSGNLILESNTFREISGAGLRLNNSTGGHEILRNAFTANHVGVHVQNQPETVILARNLIENNRDFGVRNQNSAEVDARGNWWGHLHGPFHPILNPDGLGDTVSDGVLFDPWAITPSQGTILSPIRSGTLVSGDLLRFIGSELGVAGANYLWDFGDGRRSTARRPDLVGFPEAGQFTVTYSAAVGSEGPHPDLRHYEVVADTGTIPDLRLETVHVPPTLAVGQVAQIQYTVRNVGQGTATGTWRDALYLSRDPYPDSADRRLGSQAATRNLAVGESYRNTLTVTMPAVEEGAYHLILVANDEWTLLERHRLNNEQAAPITAQVPALHDGVDFAADYETGRVEHYYRMTATGGLNLLLEAAGLDPALEVFVRFGALPTRSLYDHRLGGAGSLALPAATAGNWYVLVYGDAAVAGGYALRFDLMAVLLNRVSPTRHGTGTDLELALEGAGFFQPLSVELLAGGRTAYAAAAVDVDSFTQAVALFPAGSLPPGTYSVQVGRDGHTATLPDALHIIAGGEGRLETSLVLPASIGYNTLATLYVEYANTGDASMPAPLLMLTGVQHGRYGAILTLEHHRLSRGFWATAMPTGFAESVQFLASGETPGILQPGESRRVPVYYAGWTRPWDTSSGRPSIDWELSALLVDDNTPADWPALKAQMQPEYVRDDAWEVLWDNFTRLAGTTWGDYVAMLSRNARYLHRQGQRVENLESLLAFSMRQADGLSPLPVLAEGTDAGVEAPGLPILFSRAYLQPISRRFELGDLGRGWTHNWRHNLTIAADGTVVIADAAGTPRIFHPDSRYTGRYLAQAGDEAELRAADGGFRLTEANGLLHFYEGDLLQYLEDSNGNRISCTYAGGQLTRLTHSAGGSLDIAYNPDGRLASVTDHHGRQTRYGYDGDYLTSVQAPDGRIETYDYHTADGPQQNALTAIGFPDGTTRTFEYDDRGRLHGAWRENRQEEIAFDHADIGSIRVTDAMGNTSRVFFDHVARVIKAENALGEAVQMHFDELGNLTRVTDPAGFVTTLSYDRRGNLAEITDAMRRTVRFSYTRTRNQLATVTDPLGRQTIHTYDDRGNLTAIVYPDGSRERWAYDDPGNPIQWTNRRGNPTAFAYDDAGRITEATDADGGVVTYTYDARGNLVEAENATGIYTLAYNAADALTSVDYPGGRRLEFTYDAAGRRGSSRDQLGYQLDYHYDDAGRLARLSDGNGDLVEYAYDALGRFSRKTMGNGVYTDYAYDTVGRLLSLANRKPDGTVLSSFAYTYDRRGRRTAMGTHYGTWTYTYDDAGQLVRAVLDSTDPAIADQDLAYEYDALGNRVRTTVNGVEEDYDSNTLNQYTTVGDRTYTYDLDGNLIREESPDGVTEYMYNGENRLVGVARGGDTWEYAYDPFGNRVAVDENGIRTHYVTDPVGLGNVVGEYSDAGVLMARYTHGYGLVGRLPVAGSTSYYTFDPMANASELTGAGGIVQNDYAYRPFGNTIRHGGVVPNPFRFMGQFGVMAEKNGMFHARARLLDPERGRFMAWDPIGLFGGINSYAYSCNDPVSRLDPVGLVSIDASWMNHVINSGKAFRFVQEAYPFISGVLLKDILNSSTTSQQMALQISQYLNSSTLRYIGERIGVSYPAVKAIKVQISSSIVTAKGSGIGSFLLAKAKGLAITLKLPYVAAFAGGYAVGYGMDTYFPNNWISYAAHEWGKWWYGLPNMVGGGSTRVVASWDPNEKTGAAGFGAGNFVRPEQLLTYRIDFENYASATAPAQIVTIRDPLSDDLDWATFELGQIGFGDVLIQVPPGLKYYQTVVDYAYADDEYDFDIEVHIEAWLESGRLYFNFLSIDRETGMPPPADIGFLPPETDPETGRGRGFVSYLIRPRPGLSSGAEIRNVATIQFDFSLEIDTNQVDPLDPEQGTDPALEALVTIDTMPPASSVDTLPTVTWTTSFPVAWSGEDDALGSGIRTYDVFARQNDGPWTLWLAGTAQTGAIYPGAYGNTYSFYCVATDNVGNRESKPETAETVTMLVEGTIMRIDVAAGDGTSLVLEFGEAATATAQIDPLDILAEAGQLAHLLCPWVPDPAGQPMTRDVRPIPDDGLTRWRLEVPTAPIRGSMSLTWNVDAAADGRQIWLQALDANERPAGFPVDMRTPLGEPLEAAPGTTFEIVYGELERHAFELQRGWNMVGPRLISLQSLGAVVAGRGGDSVRLPAWRWGAAGFEPVRAGDPFCPEVGYMVYCAAEAAVIEVEGLPPDGVILLDPGWNLISPVEPGTLPVVRNAVLGAAWRWDPIRQVYRLVDVLEPGSAYWIFADTE